MGAASDGRGRRRGAEFAVCAVAGALIAVAASQLTPAEYQATSLVYVSTQSGSSMTDLQQGQAKALDRAATVRDLTTSPVVLDGVIRDLHLRTASDALAGDIAVGRPAESSLLTITASDRSATRAAAIADAVSTRLAKLVRSVQPSDSSSGAFAARPVQRAHVPGAPACLSVLLSSAMGGAAGLALALLMLLLRARPPRPPASRFALSWPPRWPGVAH